MEKRKRTEIDRPKLVFGVHRICPRCRGKGKTNYESTCRRCDGQGYIKETE